MFKCPVPASPARSCHLQGPSAVQEIEPMKSEGFTATWETHGNSLRAPIPLGHSEIQQDVPYQGQFDVFILGCHTELPRIPSSFWPGSDFDTGGLPESPLPDGLWCGDFLVLVLRRNTFGVSWI